MLGRRARRSFPNKDGVIDEARPDGRLWHFADMTSVLDDVRSQGAKRKLFARSISHCDPFVWSGRALQEVFVELAFSGLASMYRSLIGAGLLRTIMDISARAFSLADRLQRAIWVTSFACAGKTDPPSLLIPLADLGG